jgi:membrane-associated protein TcaA
MEKCSSCGAVKKELDQFCLNCGKKFEKSSNSSSEIASANSVVSPDKRRKRSIGLLAAGALLIALLAAHLVLNEKYDAAKKISEMNQAYAKADQSKFLSFFDVADDVVADEKGFYSFVEDEGWETIRGQLKTESELIEAGGLADIILDSNGNKFLSVVSEPVFFGLYKDVSFLVHPVTVEAAMPLDKTSITLGTKTLTGDKGDKIAAGKFLPGQYEWNAFAASAYSSIKNKGTASIQGDGSNYYTLNAELNGGTLKITSDAADAVLWVDGKSTKKTVKELNTIGPVPFDGSVEIMAETKDENDKTVKSETVSVEADSAHLSFAHIQEKEAEELAQRQEAEELQELAAFHDDNVKDFISFFRYEFESALNYGDFSYLTSFFPAGSSIEAEYIAKMEEHASSSVSYEYDFQTTEVTNIEAIDSDTLKAYTKEEFMYTLSDEMFVYYKTKAYTLDIEGNGYSITEIKELSNSKVEI